LSCNETVSMPVRVSLRHLKKEPPDCGIGLPTVDDWHALWT
jgi:hypothetical protein